MIGQRQGSSFNELYIPTPVQPLHGVPACAGQTGDRKEKHNPFPGFLFAVGRQETEENSEKTIAVYEIASNCLVIIEAKQRRNTNAQAQVLKAVIGKGCGYL